MVLLDIKQSNQDTNQRAHYHHLSTSSHSTTIHQCNQTTRQATHKTRALIRAAITHQARKIRSLVHRPISIITLHTATALNSQPIKA